MTQNKRSLNVNIGNPKAEALWQSAIEIIRVSPEQSSGTEFESRTYLLFTILGYELSSGNTAIAYHSAVEGENLDFLISRLEHEKSKFI